MEKNQLGRRCIRVNCLAPLELGIQCLTATMLRGCAMVDDGASMSVSLTAMRYNGPSSIWHMTRRVKTNRGNCLLFKLALAAVCLCIGSCLSVRVGGGVMA